MEEVLIMVIVTVTIVGAISFLSWFSNYLDNKKYEQELEAIAKLKEQFPQLFKD